MLRRRVGRKTKRERRPKMAKNKNGRYRFAGTEEIAGSYELLFSGPAGTVGRRVLSGSNSRIRVVPVNHVAAAGLREHIPSGWKTPDGEPGGRTFRFSTVVPSGPELLEAIQVARQALIVVGGELTMENQAALARARQAAAEEEEEV
jgi:hypothetical protein